MGTETLRAAQFVQGNETVTKTWIQIYLMPYKFYT